MSIFFRMEIQSQEMRDYVESKNKIIIDRMDDEAKVHEKEASDLNQKLIDIIAQSQSESQALKDRISEETSSLNQKLMDIITQSQSESQILKERISEDEVARQQKDREITVNIFLICNFSSL